MVKLRSIMTFVGAAAVAASLTLAPKAYSYWKMRNATTCTPYSMGFGYRGVAEGDLHVDYIGVQNSSSRLVTLICDDGHDSNSFPNGLTPLVHAKFYRFYTNSQVPRIQFCSNWYGCTAWVYGGWNVGEVNIDAYAGIWRPGRFNVMNVDLDGTNQDWSAMKFNGFTVGTEVGPW